MLCQLTIVEMKINTSLSCLQNFQEVFFSLQQYFKHLDIALWLTEIKDGIKMFTEKIV